MRNCSDSAVKQLADNLNLVFCILKNYFSRQWWEK